MKYTTANVFDHPLNNSAEFQEAFQDFLTMRKKMRKPPTERAIKLLIKNLIELSGGKEDIAVKIIDRSIVNNWLDFYQLKEETDFSFHQSSTIGKKREEI